MQKSDHKFLHNEKNNNRKNVHKSQLGLPRILMGTKISESEK